MPELHRVISPGCGLALLWNWWDERDPLQHARRARRLCGQEPYREEELPGKPWFVEAARNVVELGVGGVEPEALVGYLSTVSSYLVAEPGEREESLRAVHELAAQYGERFPLPRLTYVFVFATAQLTRGSSGMRATGS